MEETDTRKSFRVKSVLHRRSGRSVFTLSIEHLSKGWGRQGRRTGCCQGGGYCNLHNMIMEGLIEKEIDQSGGSEERGKTEWVRMLQALRRERAKALGQVYV